MKRSSVFFCLILSSLLVLTSPASALAVEASPEGQLRSSEETETPAPEEARSEETRQKRGTTLHNPLLDSKANTPLTLNPAPHSEPDSAPHIEPASEQVPASKQRRLDESPAFAPSPHSNSRTSSSKERPLEAAAPSPLPSESEAPSKVDGEAKYLQKKEPKESEAAAVGEKEGLHAISHSVPQRDEESGVQIASKREQEAEHQQEGEESEEAWRQGIHFPLRIDEIEIRGLWRTSRKVVLRELPYKPGDLVDEEAWELGISRLWNTDVFSRVSGKIVVLREGSGEGSSSEDAIIEGERGQKERKTDQKEQGRSKVSAAKERHIAVLSLEERWTILPILRFKFADGILWAELGAFDLNLFGRLFDVGFYYERFGEFNGGSVWFKDPRFLNKFIEFSLTLEHLTRPRRGFVVTGSAARLGLLYEANPKLRWGMEFEGVRHAFSADASGDPLPQTSYSLVSTGVVRAGVINTKRLMYEGSTLELRPSLGFGDSPEGPVFAQLVAEATSFVTFGKRWNLGLRGHAGLSSPVQPQFHFWFGGLDWLRGFEDNHLQGSAYAGANAELRLVAFDSTWLAFMPVAFVDGVWVKPEHNSPAGALSIGLGLRGMIPRLVNTILRVDIAYTLLQERDWKPVVASGHLF